MNVAILARYLLVIGMAAITIQRYMAGDGLGYLGGLFVTCLAVLELLDALGQRKYL